MNIKDKIAKYEFKYANSKDENKKNVYNFHEICSAIYYLFFQRLDHS